MYEPMSKEEGWLTAYDDIGGKANRIAGMVRAERAETNFGIDKNALLFPPPTLHV